VAGLDLGSTGIKVLIADELGTEVLVRQQPTPWRAGPGGTTELDADALIAAVRVLLATAAQDLRAVSEEPLATIEVLAVSGMGETGFLVDREGRALAPGIAWFDPRGRAEIDTLPAHLLEQFAGRTGLPVGAQVSVAKLIHLRDRGVDLRSARWFNLPEFVAMTLGAEGVSEYSLASRTGLLDQDTGTPWLELIEHLGASERLLPPLVHAGTPLGAATASWVPDGFLGAQVTVAGHDHLVSAVSGGLISDDRYHVSMGTAEVLLRVVDEPLSFDDRAELARYFINCVRHVVPGRSVIVAGVKSGLLMRRALQLSGITDRAGRDRLDEEASALPLEGALGPDSVEVRGARNDDGVLAVTVRGDGVSPAELFNAVLRHSNDEIQLLVDAMDRVIPPARSSLLTGGWAGMASVQRARRAVLPGLVVSGRDQDTAYGAALFALGLLQSDLQPAVSRDPV
jgi:sugar (pentulose or hexulose) kinase